MFTRPEPGISRDAGSPGPEKWGGNALRIPWEAVVSVEDEHVVVRL
jgi:hypothetical protein